MRLRRELNGRNAVMDRRGDMAAGELVAILLVLVAGAVIIFWFVDIRTNITSVQDGVCASQVRAAAATSSVFGREYNTSMPGCQTEYVTIKGSDIGTGEEAENRTKYLLAEEMRSCWDQWGRGELELFQDSNEYCAFCTNIGFDAKAQEAIEDGRIDGFGQYLKDTKSPKGMSYDEYFTGTSLDPVVMPADQQNFLLETDKNLTIIFYYEKVRTSSSSWQAFLSWTQGREVGAWEATESAGEALVYTATGAGVIRGAATAVSTGSIGAGIGTGVATTVRTATGFARRIIMHPLKATGVATMMYTRMRMLEKHGSISAIYITRFEEDNTYVQTCKTQAESTRSP